MGVSVVLLLCTRKICIKFLTKNEAKTNTDAYIGIKFVVDEIQENYTYHKINGVAWRIYATEGETLEVGAEYEICAIQGNKLIAKKVNK